MGSGPRRGQYGIFDTLLHGSQRYLPGQAGGSQLSGKFIAQQNEEYVILSDSNVLCPIDLSKVLEAHIASGCDVTAVTKSGIADGKKELDLAIKTDDAGQVTQMAVDYVADASYDASMGIFVMKRTLLMEAAKESTSRNRYRLERDFILRSFDEGKDHHAYLPVRRRRPLYGEHAGILSE